MPELPELEVVCEVLNRRIIGETITAAESFPPGGPIVLRDLTGQGFGRALAGARFDTIVRRGKFLVFTLSADLSAVTEPGSASEGLSSVVGRPSSVYLIINPKLSGRLQLCPPKAKKAGPVHAVLHLSGGHELRYVDQKKMGQVFVTSQPPEQAPIADYAGMGPEALDISREAFRARLKPYRGEIKGVLIRSDFVAGIGNAYADEILWHARLHPYRKRTSLTPEEVDRLYEGMRTCLLGAIQQVRTAIGEDIHREARGFMAVHLKTGEPCPRCGTTISHIGANQRITNFCRTCQPGGLIKGM
jgi:formamidopyrimidine-DNA glycosylase